MNESSAGADQLRALLGAVLAIGGDLDLEAVLTRVTETAVELAEATYGALGVLDPTGTHLVQFITVGLDESVKAQIGPPPNGHGILGRLILDPRPLRLPDLRRHPDSFGFPPGHPEMTSFLGVPVFVRSEVFGNLYLADKVGGGEFTAADVDLMTGLASAAAVAIDNARLHARARETDLIQDRERIARDLHDTVIQRLFATGLSLQAATRFIDRPEALERNHRSIDDLDETVREIRYAIFGLHELPMDHDTGFRRSLLAIGDELGDALGFEPSFRLDGPLDTVVSPSIVEHALAVVREGLANVARHALADHAEVVVSAIGDHLVVQVDDSGIGPTSSTRAGNGLANVMDRAAELGGSATFGARRSGGSSLRWTVPLAAAS